MLPEDFLCAIKKIILNFKDLQYYVHQYLFNEEMPCYLTKIEIMLCISCRMTKGEYMKLNKVIRKTGSLLLSN